MAYKIQKYCVVFLSKKCIFNEFSNIYHFGPMLRIVTKLAIGKKSNRIG